MSDEESAFTTEQELRDIYYNPIEGYQSAQKLHEAARDRGLDVSQKQVGEWLAHQSTYVRFRQPTKKFKTRQTYVPHMGDQLQMDLVDMSKYEKGNKDYQWILTGIDVFSRSFCCSPEKEAQRLHFGGCKKACRAVRELLQTT